MDDVAARLLGEIREASSRVRDGMQDQWRTAQSLHIDADAPGTSANRPDEQ